jgi:hypothetical protein
MDVISVRVDSATRGRMASMKDVNWAEVVRSALRERLDIEEDLRQPIDRARARRAARRMDAMRKSLPVLPYASTREIRKWRESRK